MPPSRLAVILGPLIALVLIGGLVVTVVRDPDRTELAQDPGDEVTSEPTVEATSEPVSTEPADVVATETPSPAVTPSATAPVPSDSATPAGTASPAQPGVGAQVAVEDPTALTGGWQGGTPNTGTAVSSVGLLLLVGGAMLWLRRSRG